MGVGVLVVFLGFEIPNLVFLGVFLLKRLKFESERVFLGVRMFKT